MANNPMFGTKQTANNATAPSNPLNTPDKRYFRGRNKFPYDRKLYGTFRYADIMPFECVHGVEGDILRFGSTHSIRTHPLASIIQSPLYLKKTYTMVDYKVILPKNWDKIYKVPVDGDDVPSSAICSMPNFFARIAEFITKQLTTLQSLGNSNLLSLQEVQRTIFFRCLRLWELIFSPGGLLNYLGYHTAPLYEQNNHEGNFGIYYGEDVTEPADYADSITQFMNILYDQLNDCYFGFRFSDGSEFFPKTVNHFRYALERFSDEHDAVIIPDTTSQDPTGTRLNSTIMNTIKSLLSTVPYVVHQDDNNAWFNYAPLAAYQITCATFFSRDSIDNVFSAEHYRDMLSYYFRMIHVTPNTFAYNGRTCEFDVLSANTFATVLSTTYTIPTNITSYKLSSLYPAFGYLFSLFNINKSLRFGDYFTGSKIKPLAVGDVTAQINDNAVNAIDVTISLLKARFLNAVNRSRNSYKSFIEDVMDGSAPPRDDEPRWLATVTSRVSGFEVENTNTADQGKIVTLLRSSDSKYIYELEVGTPCIVIGVVTFEMPRVYSKTADRFFYHRNRYDMFNKFMQYSGDQAIKNNELDTSYSGNLDNGTNFSYTPRHMEYKQRFPIAAGDYVGHLKSYLFVTDNLSDVDPYDGPTPHIDEFYIRSRNIEFDRFFKSLSNYDLSGYYHFFIEFDNLCTAYRKMEKNPTIL